MALLNRLYRYLHTKLRVTHERRADPRIELEQSLEDARRQHRQLRDRAAQVIAHEKHTEMKLREASDSAAQLRSRAREALQLADEAHEAGNADRTNEMQLAAESFTERLIAVEREIDDLSELLTQAQSASQEAQQTVQQHAVELRQQLHTAHRVRGQIDQTELSRQLNDLRDNADDLARSADESPTVSQVADKVQLHYSEELGRRDALQHSNTATEPADNVQRSRAEARVETDMRLRHLRAELESGHSEPQPSSRPEQ